MLDECWYPLRFYNIQNVIDWPCCIAYLRLLKLKLASIIPFSVESQVEELPQQNANFSLF